MIGDDTQASFFVAAPHQVRRWRRECGRAARAPLVSRILTELRGAGLTTERIETELCLAWNRHEALRTELCIPTGYATPALHIRLDPPKIVRESLSTLSPRQARQTLFERYEALAVDEAVTAAPTGGALLVALPDGAFALALWSPAANVDSQSLQLIIEEIADRLAGLHIEERAGFSEVAGWLADGTESAPAPTLADARALRTTALFEVSRAANPLDGGAADAPLLAAWVAVLSRFHATPPIHVETLVNLRDIVGPTAGAGPYEIPHGIEFEIEDTTVFADLLRTIARDTLERASPPSGALGELPFGFSYSRQGRERAGCAVSMEVLDIDHPMGHCPIAMECYESGGGVRFRLRFDPTSYPAAQVDSMATAVCAVLVGGCERANDKLCELPLADGATPPGVLQGQARAGSQLAYATLFSSAAARAPEKTAIVLGQTSWTFERLDRESDELCAWLSASGIAVGEIVAVLLPRSPELLAAAIGIFKLGAVFLPLDIAAPEAAQHGVLIDAGASALLTASTEVAGRPTLAAFRCLLLDARPPFSGSAAGASRPMPDPDSPAYILYTSGSTGVPKGVVLSHRGFSNYVQFAAREYRLAEGRGAIVQSPVTFDLTFTALFAPLIVGQTLLLAPEDSASAGAYIEFVRDQLLAGNVTLLKTTPSYLRLLNGLMPAGSLNQSVLSIVIGGEALQWTVIEPWLEHAPTTRLFNEYGPTETVVGCICARILERTSDFHAPIGKPIDNTTIIVLDAAGRPVQRGVIGEITVGGHGVGIEYRRRPELTARQFISVHIPSVGHDRFYRTGDRGRITEHDSVEFLGRLDDQLKVNGVRIEPSHIQALLNRQPGVAQSAVIKITEAEDLDRLVAIVLPAPRATLDAARLSEILASHLAPLYRPRNLVIADALPLNANGKIDQKALVRLIAAEASDDPQEAATNPVEAKLASIFCSVLSKRRVGIDDNFFDLGGDSIRSIAIVGRAAQEGLRFSIADLFREPTVRQLAVLAQANTARTSASTTAFSLLRAGDREKLPPDVIDAYPISALQLAMIYHNDKDLAAAVYHDIFSYHITFAPDLAVLERAAADLVSRHEALRTTFHVAGYSDPLQLVHREGVSILTIEDITALSATEQQAFIEAHFAREKRRPFQVSCLPLVRLRFFIRDSKTVQLTMSFHHAIIDGWSDVLLLTELFKLYHAGLRSIPPPPPNVTRYRDFVELERAAVANPASRDYWRTLLTDLPEPLRPASNDRGSVAVTPVPVAPEAADALRRLCLEHSLPLKSFLLALHLKVMSVLSGNADVLTAMVASGRPETSDGDQLIGLFINSIPLRATIEGCSWLDLVRQVMQLEARLLPHRRFPLAEMKSMVGDRSLSSSLFYYTNYHIAKGLEEFGIELLQLIPHEASSFQLVANFWIDPFSDRLKISVATDQHAYTDAERPRIAGYYQRAVESLLHDATADHREMTLLSPEEAVIEAPPRSPRPSATMDERIRQSAHERPLHIALIDGDVALSYESVDRRAGLCAARLAQLGVIPGDRVLIGKARSWELVIAILGVWRAGAVYVPIDPATPPNRIAHILEDCRPRLTIGDEPARVLAERAACAFADLDDLVADGRAIATPSRSEPERDCYLFYTSGSSGRPKGVLVSHAALSGFGVAMTSVLARDRPGVWLAATAPTFDISLLELIWTLANGYSVVLQGDPTTFIGPASRRDRVKAAEFSLFFFASQDGASAYDFLISAARRADELGFAALWTPERHFHEFGGPFPNAALTCAALATITKRIALRAGSLVLPLHNPVRAAEDWAMVDNLSGGRAGIAVASGWHQEDFVLSPDAFEQRRDSMIAGIATMRRLWRGEKIELRGPHSTHQVGIFPRPLRGDIPVWLSAAASPATFETAGRLGFRILTHLLSQDKASLAANIAHYRRLAGERAHVTLMIHTFVGVDDQHALDVAAAPFKDYLLSSVDLVRSTIDGAVASSASEADIDELVELSVRRYLSEASLIGSHDTCVDRAARYRDIGIDEFACLIDFGIPGAEITESLARLDRVRAALSRRESRNRSVAENIEAHGVTHLQCTPTVLRELIGDERSVTALAGLDVLLVGGEALPESLAERVRSGGVKRLLNMYGPTETTIWSSFDEVGEAPVTIGRPLGNSALYVLGADGHSAPFGTPGELYIGGTGLARGYWRQPELTASRFVTSPFRGHDDSVRLYRTGDSAMRTADGRHRFLGRLDRQIKLAGHRIELQEIEHAALAHAAVSDCVAMLHGAIGITLAVVSPVGQRLAEPLAATLEAALPVAMLPRRIVVLEALPRTTGGKLDAHLLAQLFEAQSPSQSSAVKPTTDVELLLASLWEQTLGTAPGDVHENFFSAGGNSLRATVMTGRIRQATSRHITVRSLFDHPTIAGLAALLQDARRVTGDREAARWNSSEWPLGLWQERLWLIDRIAPGKAAYNDVAYVRVEGLLDIARVRRTVENIIERHDALRATFHHHDGVPYATYAPTANVEFVHVCFDSLGAHAAREAAAAKAREIAGRPFDLATGPLVRVMAGSLNGCETVLLLVIHHIAADGWSLALFLREFSLLYTDSSALTLAPPSYAQIAVQERTTADRKRLSEMADYWRRQLTELPPPLELPLDFRRPSAENFVGRVESIVVPDALGQRLGQLAQTNRATLFMVMAAALAVALQRMTGRQDLLIGTDVANRSAPGALEVIGLFVNQIVLRFDLQGSPSFTEFLSRIREMALDAYEHQEYPFNLLVDELSPHRDLGRNPIYQIAFTLQEAADTTKSGTAGLHMSTLPIDLDVSRLDLEINAHGEFDGIHVDARYNSALYRPELIARLLSGYQLLLGAIVEDPARSILQLPFFDDQHRDLVLNRFNRTTVHYPTESIVSLFERHSQLAPQSVAIVSGADRLRYGELATLIEATALGLHGAGVQRGDIVAVLSPRGPALVIAMMSLWRIGAIYLPLDANQPAHRSAVIMGEATCQFILCPQELNGLADLIGDAMEQHKPRPIVLEQARAAGLVAQARGVLERHPEGSEVAYVLFTSGSTGKPKGARVYHRGMMNHLQAKIADLGMSHADACAQTAPQTFDISIWQMLAPLATGGRLVIVDDDTAQTPGSLCELIEEAEVTVVELVPTMLDFLLAAASSQTRPMRFLRWMISTGEALPVTLCRKWFDKFPNVPLMNAYGPTECSDDVTHFVLRGPPLESEVSVPIGSAIGNVRLYVVDEETNLVPLGAVGQLIVCGVCVGGGYLNNPEATRRAFFDDPFDRASEFRAYRTGDLVRRRADGNLDYLGRIDHQVKVGGCRIELGEIESALDSNALVHRSVVSLVDAALAGKRLCAHVVPNWSAFEEFLQDSERARRTAEWQSIYDYYYTTGDAAGESPASDVTFDTRGWNDSYTRAAFPQSEMRAWLEQTLTKLRRFGARRILEIGCGSGMILFGLAGDCERYAAIDLSEAIVQRMRKTLATRYPHWDHVSVATAEAHDLSAYANETFDLVVVNSVVQYFPSADYLTRTLELASALLAPHGRIFLGDIRSLELLDALQTSIVVHRADAAATRERVRAEVPRLIAAENELILAQGFFEDFAHRAGPARMVTARFSLKNGVPNNELFKYRFDVALEYDGIDVAEDIESVAWSDAWVQPDSLREHLSARGGRPLIVRGVPNSRLARDRRIRAWLNSDVAEPWSESQAGSANDELRPEEFVDSVERCGYGVQMRLSALDPFCFDALLSTTEVTWPFLQSPAPSAGYNNPLRARAGTVLTEHLREHLQSVLPSFMVPQVIMILDEFPLNRSGKIDRSALPVPTASTSSTGTQPARTTAEEILVGIWRELLGTLEIGIRSNFFASGGDSILGIQMVARAGRRGLRFTPRAIFEHQTIAELAAVAAFNASPGEANRAALSGSVPLSPIQAALLERRLEAPHHWNQAILVGIEEPVSAQALGIAIEMLTDRHDALRLRFKEAATGWEQFYAPGGACDIHIGPSDEESWAAFADRLNASFSLADGPLFKCALRPASVERGAMLLLVAHHLVIDGVSWRMILDDLSEILAAHRAGRPVRFSPPSATYRAWVERLIGIAESRAARDHLPFWLEQGRPHPRPLFARPEDGATSDAKRTRILERRLCADVTQRLVRLEVDEHHVALEEILLAAVMMAIDAEFGRKDVVILCESHGRDAVSDIDLNGSVGWFTAAYPLRVRLPRSASLRELLETVARVYRSAKGLEMTYGVMRYLDPDDEIRRALADRPDPELGFNYFGQFGASARMSGISLAQGYAGAIKSPQDYGLCPLEVNALIRADRLEMYWTFDERAVGDVPVSRLADACEGALATLCDSLAGDPVSLKTVATLDFATVPANLYKGAIEELGL